MFSKLQQNVSHTTRALFFASCFAVVLDIARVGISQKINFIFLIWNLFLAWIPYTLATMLHLDTSKRRFALIFVPWLLFFPNAAYLITDILHVDFRPPVPLWYDSLIFFIFGWLGIMLASIALLRVHKYLEYNFGKIKSTIAVLGIAVITAFGIYIGRFERFNSWDVLLDPLNLFKNIISIWTEIPHTIEPLFFTGIFTLVILCTYYVVREVVKDTHI
ncbi:MAG: hypothetical protein RI996_438 [Candidatus Parcubacteria bacterium]|jgi:uncharacterized membrane protein